MRAKSIVLGVLCLAGSASAQTWTQLTPFNCPTSSAGLFTQGGQYVDTATNGVLQDSWSMLMRWQGPMLSPVTYDGGRWTGFSPPAPASAWQRGHAPEFSFWGSPLTQLHCFDAGMILNSFYASHEPVVGGGWNDMYGYAFGPGHRPHAFVPVGSGFSELVIQGNVAVPYFVGASVQGAPTLLADPSQAGSAQVNFFVYLQDLSRPDLHPIAVETGIFSPGFETCQAFGDFGRVGKDYPNGVWYTAAPFCPTDVSTVGYTAGFTTGSTFSAPTFYRIHMTAKNLTNLITRINRHQCNPGEDDSCDCSDGCPSSGYSMNPNNYLVQYAGVIAETTVLGGTTRTDVAVGLATRASGVSVYSYIPPARPLPPAPGPVPPAPEPATVEQ